MWERLRKSIKMPLSAEELRRIAVVERAVEEARRLAQQAVNGIERHMAACEVLQRTTVNKLQEMNDSIRWSGRYLLGLLMTVIGGIIVEFVHTAIR